MLRFFRNLPLKIVTLLLLCLAASGFRAQEFKFSSLNIDNGLSQSVVNCIFQDKKGFMWMATQEGLNRYDGYNFKVFKHFPDDTNSIASSFIFTIYQDRTGIFWIGTKDAGLERYDEITGRFSHFSHDEKNKDCISNNTVRCVFEDNAGNLWLGTENGLNRMDRKTGKFTSFLPQTGQSSSISGSRIYAITEDKNGLIWIATYSGLSVFDPKTQQFSNYNISEEQLEKFHHLSQLGEATQANIREAATHFRTLLLREDGNLWVGTDGAGLLVFDITARNFSEAFFTSSETLNKSTGSSGLDPTRVLSLADDGSDHLWIGTYGGGVLVLHKATGQTDFYLADENDPFALIQNEIRTVLRDVNGNMWIGTNGGVSVYFRSMDKFPHYRKTTHSITQSGNSLSSNIIMSFTEDKDSLLWIGTLRGGLNSLNRKTGVYAQYPQLSTSTKNDILSLHADSKNRIWVGTYGGGINMYDKATGKMKFYIDELVDGTILCITEDKSGHIWFGTWSGFYELNPETDKLTLYNDTSKFPSLQITSMIFDHSGNLWIGTAGGLMKRNQQTGQIVSYISNPKEPTSISSNSIYSIYEDKSGNIWIGTAGGLNRLDVKTGKFTAWYQRDGLPADVINGVLGDKQGRLWLSTNKGLTRFDPSVKNENGSAFRNFSTSEGLQRGEYNQGAFYSNARGEMFFGGVGGFNVFYPDRIFDRDTKPQVYVTSFQRFGKEIPFSDTLIMDRRLIELDWRENNFTLEFTALDYVMPGKNLYQYKLEGYDDDWSHPGTSRIANYTNIPPGTYIFRVRGANSDGVWNNEGAYLIIHISPPFWKTKWFLVLCILISTLAVFGFIRLRTAAIRRENAVLESRVNERTAELAQKNKDITDSITYAKRIQLAILPSLQTIYSHLPQTFIVYRPKDIVSGDFYWFAERNGRKIFATVDCTGHGVPGAFMSMIGHNLLNQIVIENGITEPAQILNELHRGVRNALKQGGQTDTTDGMDLAICSFDLNSREIQYAGALRPLIIFRKGEMTRVEPDRFSIGGTAIDTSTSGFTNHTLRLESGDILYMFTDGYADQFGGDKGKKFMVKRLLDRLGEIHRLPMQEQSRLLETALDEWQGNHQQVDDILVVGIRL